MINIPWTGRMIDAFVARMLDAFGASSHMLDAFGASFCLLMVYVMLRTVEKAKKGNEVMTILVIALFLLAAALDFLSRIAIYVIRTAIG